MVFRANFASPLKLDLHQKMVSRRLRRFSDGTPQHLTADHNTASSFSCTCIVLRCTYIDAFLGIDSHPHIRKKANAAC